MVNDVDLIVSMKRSSGYSKSTSTHRSGCGCREEINPNPSYMRRHVPVRLFVQAKICGTCYSITLKGTVPWACADNVYRAGGGWYRNLL